MTASDSSVSPSGRPEPRFRWRVGIAIVALLALAILTARLGFWQLSRAEQKQEIAAKVEAGREAALLPLGGTTLTDSDLQPWRPVWAHGFWLPATTVLLNNRNHEGQPGYWVVTAMCLLAPDASEPPPLEANQAMDCPRAIAVLRGWVPRPYPGPGLPVVPELPELPDYDVIEGELLTHVPRLFELGSLSGDEPPPLRLQAGEVPLVQNLELDAYTRATGLTLLPRVLQQTQASWDDGLQRDWAGPPVDVDQHRGYALQWFSFSAIALIALGVLLVKVIRNAASRRR